MDAQFKGLVAGDTVELVAPASRCDGSRIEKIKGILASFGLRCLVPEDLFGPDLLCANGSAQRFFHLKEALMRPETKAILCVRGGYGSMHLIPDLLTLKDKMPYKLFIGMSDITALHLFFNQYWHWPVLHASLGGDELASSQARLRAYLLGQSLAPSYEVMAYNPLARQEGEFNASIIGGNLSILQSSIGTCWQIQACGRYLLIEEVNERAYRVDRMLTHLTQAGCFNGVKGIILGDFLGGAEPNGRSLIDPVLLQFAQKQTCPVFRLKGVGHGAHNDPIPLGPVVKLCVTSFK